MRSVMIRRPKIEDKEELNRFFAEVVTDTFAREGLAELREEIGNEIKAKNRYLQSDYDSSGEVRYFLLALARERIIGSIEYGRASELIDRCTDGELRTLVEVGTVFVHPDYQGRGVGNLLLNAMYSTLKTRGIAQFCLDSGYTHAQKIWRKKFGEPAYVLKDFWSEGFDHMIWRVKLDDVLP